MIELLEKHGIIYNYDAIIKVMSDRAGRYISEVELEEILNENCSIYYFTANAQTSNEISTSEENAVLKIIETTVMDTYNKYPLCLSYKKNELGDWIGCYVGTRYFLYSKQLAQYVAAPKKESKSELGSISNEALSGDATFLQQVYAVLYYKEDWVHNNNLLRLDNYIVTLRRKIDADIAKGNKANIILNSTGTKYIFNSKLLDCFGNYVHIMAEQNNYRYSYVSSRQFMHDNGFEVSVLNVPPVEFFTDISDVVFKADIEDIDLSDVASLHHIITERRFRFPEHIRSKSDFEIMNCLRISIDHSVKMSKIDYKFVVPMYSVEYDKIQFLMPVYFDFGTTNSAELALVLNSSNGIWQIKTILPIESAFCNARLISSLSTSWLNSIAAD